MGPRFLTAAAAVLALMSAAPAVAGAQTTTPTGTTPVTTATQTTAQTTTAPTATTGTPEPPAQDVAPIVPVPGETAAATPPAATPPPVIAPAPTPGAPAAAPKQVVGLSGTGGVDTDPSPSPFVVLLIVVGGLALLLLLIAAIARWRAWDPPWLRRARHSCSEASWRVSGTWSEFTDWVRIGR
jgi:hypothetical protein